MTRRETKHLKALYFDLMQLFEESIPKPDSI